VRRVVAVGGREAHWNGENDKFDEVKVNTAERGQSEMHADICLFAGMVSPVRPFDHPPPTGL